MKSRVWITILLADALLLGAAVFFLRRQHTPANAVPAPADATRNRTRLRPRSTNGLPAVVIQTNQFHWRQLESADYRTYIANLRGVGCPEATIKDIILTDIMKLFAERRGQFYQNGREFKFWETSEKRALNARQLEQREKELAKIDKEVPGVLRDLLGINYDRELNKYFVDNRDDEKRLGFVSEDKRNQLLALREKVEGLRERLFDQAQQGQPVDLEELKKIQENQKEALDQLLTPEEREQYALRTSETAERLRSQLVGFNPTEQEFRDIFKLWQAHDEKFAFISADDPNAAQARQEDELRVEAAIQARLSPERVVDYERSKNQDFQLLAVFGQRYELPQATVDSLFQIRQTAEGARQNLMAQQSLGEPERQAALAAIQEETERTVRDSLGEKLYPVYTRSAGAWLQALGSVPQHGAN